MEPILSTSSKQLQKSIVQKPQTVQTVPQTVQPSVDLNLSNEGKEAYIFSCFSSDIYSDTPEQNPPTGAGIRPFERPLVPPGENF